jgi:hypothetical protein
MITTPDGLGHFAVIRNGYDMTNDIPLQPRAKKRGFTMPDQPDFEETVPTDFGGLNERRYYTASGMRMGMLLVIASSIVATLAIIVLISTLGA